MKHHKKKKRKVVRDDNEQNTETTIIVNDKQTHHFSQKLRNKKIQLKNNLSQKLDEFHLKRDTDDRRSERNVIADADREDHLINIGSINDIKTGAGLVVGYANEPLLPIVKACNPLIKIVYDLSTYVQISLHATPEQPLDGLTIDESAAIRLYTMEW